MSASSKKKLRKEQEAAKLTEQQLTARKETKKTQIYTICFVTVMVVLLVIAITVGVNQTITSSGIREKNTVAMTVGTNEISNAEMNYFFVDSVNSISSYASMFGITAGVPLNEQVVDEETGRTWADDFMDSAKSSAQAVYALVDAANAAGFTLTEAQQESLDANLDSLALYAAMYGYADADAYLKAMYGNGADLDSYRAYCENSTLASAYQTHYTEALTYDDAALRSAEAEDFNAYSSYNYNSYYLSATRFREGGTTAENGTTTYSDEEKAAAVTAAEEAAKSLVGEDIVTVADLDAAIAALSVNEGSTTAASSNSNVRSTSISSTYAEWVTDESRKAGDKTYIASTSTSTAEDGTETTTVSGYYVLFFNGVDDNTFALKNVRHILVSFEGGTTDSSTGVTTYSDEEKAAAKTEAEAILADWKAGEASEDSFAALANEKSDDGDGTTGGLYENVYPGQMVENFESWCYEDSRKAGDTGIVESTYGYHVMFFSGDAELTYRDYLIETDLRNADAQEWYNGLVEAATVTDGDLKYVRMDLALNAA